MNNTIYPLTVEDFLALPEGDITYELVDARAVPKMSPKYFHASVQLALLFVLERILAKSGRILPKWAVRLQRKEKDWIPVPDLLYISYDRLPKDWFKDEPCPVAPELALEIISPGQTIGDLTEKAGDYLKAGVLRVWVIDPSAKSLTVFYPESPPQTFKGEMTLADELFPNLELTVREIFTSAGLS